VTLAVAEIAQQRTVRLIPTAYYKPPVLSALADNDNELAILERLEGLTCRRLQTPAILPDYDAWGRSLIEAAFKYRRKGGCRFNDEGRGAWYAGFSDRTSLAEVAYHHTRELEYMGHLYDQVQYRALNASFIGRFNDLRSAAADDPCLHPDITVGYPAGQGLARQLISDGSRGLIYPSVRDLGGICIVAFQPNVVQDVTSGANWRLEWDGSTDWRASAA